jgi:two-component system CheB/CheR fusion protein
MNNLLAGTGIGTVFVNQELRVARFTPAATQVMNLIPTDVGRPVEHIVSNLVEYPGLTDDIRKVLDTLAPKEAEVRAKGGTWYLMRIRPYRTLDNVIEGAVLTFVDITERKRAESALADSQARFYAIVNQAFAGVAQARTTGHYTLVNNRYCELLGLGRDQLLGTRGHALIHPDDLKGYEVLFDALVAGGPDFLWTPGCGAPMAPTCGPATGSARFVTPPATSPRS